MLRPILQTRGPPDVPLLAIQGRIALVKKGAGGQQQTRRGGLVWIVAVLSLLGAACSTEPQARTVQTPSESPPTTRDLSIGRTAGEGDTDESAQTLETNDGSDDPVEASNANVVQVLGSVRSSPVDAVDWQEQIPTIESDLATIASLSCDLGADCDAESIAAWAQGRVDVVNLATSANVLALDQLALVQETLENVDVAVVGFGANLEAAESPFVFANGDVAVSIHAVSLAAVPEVSANDQSGGIAGPDSFAAVLEAVANSREAEQGIVVMVDWGGLEQRAPDESQIDAVEQLIESGADAVIGHGSDFLQRFDQIGSGVAVYGLGNAVSTSAEPLRLDTSVFRLEFARPGRSCLLPATASPQGPALDEPANSTCEN